MNAADVVGWIINGTYFCDNCKPSNNEDPDTHPIFGDSETDSFNHCETCGELIQECLTSAGLSETLARMEEFLIMRRGVPSVLRQWAEAMNDYFGPGDEGRVICRLVLEATKDA